MSENNNTTNIKEKQYRHLFEFRYFFLLYLFNCKLYLKSYLFLFVYLKQHLNLVFKTNLQNFTGTQTSPNKR